MEHVNGTLHRQSDLRRQLDLQWRLLTGFESLIMDRLRTAQSAAVVALHGLLTLAQEAHTEVSFKGSVATILCSEFHAMRHVQWSEKMVPAAGPVPSHIVSSLLARSTAVEHYISLLQNWTAQARSLFGQNDVLLSQNII